MFFIPSSHNLLSLLFLWGLIAGSNPAAPRWWNMGEEGFRIERILKSAELQSSGDVYLYVTVLAESPDHESWWIRRERHTSDLKNLKQVATKFDEESIQEVRKELAKFQQAWDLLAERGEVWFKVIDDC